MTFRIVTDKDGSHASNGFIGMSVLREGTIKLFKRCALKNSMTPSVRQVEWLVGELDGVRCYIKQDGLSLNVVMTKQDLYP